ncbi:FHA domain-containing protein [Polyangium spumosum]|uniref:FHA domain-containing protein n=1 Tax=Polyangium spumosum TaxID=889282 RepID=UPI00129BB3A3
MTSSRRCNTQGARTRVASIFRSPRTRPIDGTLPAETPASSLSVPSFRLHVVSGPDAGQAICSTSERVVVGTHPSCDLRLSDRLVSRFHCELSVAFGQIVLRDLNSRNGTRLDDVQVREAFPRWRGRARRRRGSRLPVSAALEVRSEAEPWAPGGLISPVAPKTVRIRQPWLKRACRA